MVACESFNAYNYWMVFVKDVDKTSSNQLRNDDAYFQEDAVVVHRKRVWTNRVGTHIYRWTEQSSGKPTIVKHRVKKI